MTRLNRSTSDPWQMKMNCMRVPWMRYRLRTALAISRSTDRATPSVLGILSPEVFEVAKASMAANGRARCPPHSPFVRHIPPGRCALSFTDRYNAHCNVPLGGRADTQLADSLSWCAPIQGPFQDSHSPAETIIGVTILTHCVSRRVKVECLTSLQALMELSGARLLIILVFVDSWLFLFTSAPALILLIMLIFY